MSFGARTDAGSVRAHNEDRYLTQPPRYAVADGLGGQVSGEIASAIAVEMLEAMPRTAVGLEGLVTAVRTINRSVREAANANPTRRGMATTLTVIELDGQTAHLAHVGDSRAYLYRANALRQLTSDHTYASELVESLGVTTREASSMVDQTVLTRAVGATDDIEVDGHELGLRAGDRLLLCSDGLTQEVPDSAILAVLRVARTPQDAADELVSGALRAGGRDNVTCVVVDVERDGRQTGSRRPRRALRALLLIGVVLVAAIAVAWALMAGGLLTLR